MASISKILLSGSTNGRFIQVTGTGTGSADTIHTAVGGSDNLDEVHLFATNYHTGDVTVTIEYGGTGASNEVSFTLPPNVGLIELVPSFLLQNSLVIKAYADVTAVVNVGGFVNRITI
jgi:hypothetical protein